MRRRRLQQDVIRYADLIEAQMRRIGIWPSGALRPEPFEFKKAFAMDTVTSGQWLQFVFLPRAHETAASGRLPETSSVGVQGVREFATHPQASHVVTLLSEFDALFQ